MSNVTPTRIIYSDEFKRYFLREHGKGRGVTEIFRNAGLLALIIGRKRIERCAAGGSGRIIVVTNEQAIHPIPNNPLKKEPKIPDVVEAMGVRSINLREFYDASGDLIPLPYPIRPTL